jgi:endonuclease/exonuclease/phosphatase family metal-dependent hydrolase
VFKVMTWNVENLFRPGADSGPDTEPVYQAKLEGLADMINSETPDALSVQEIGDPAALADLVALLNGTWQQRVSAHPDQRHIRVAWLSPRPISDPEDILNFPEHLQAVQTNDDGTSISEMGRGAVVITVTSGSGKAVRLVTTHLKSKLLTFPGGRFNPHDEAERARYATYALDRRAAEAATIRIWAMNTLAAAPADQPQPLILTGDLNDTVQAATTQLLLGPPGSEIKTAGFSTPDQGDRQRLWNLAPLMPEGKNYSRVNQGRKELIDHILVSAAIVKPLTDITVEAVIDQPLPSITSDPSARRNAPSSDHAPVVATFANL